MSEYIEIYEGYQIKPHKEHPKTYVIVTDGKGGKIPDIMTGMFTDKRTARSVIDFYLVNKPRKETKNAEAGTKSGD